MRDVSNSRYRARLARTSRDLETAQRLRHEAFHSRAGVDRDCFDGICSHVLIEEAETGRLAGCFRMLPLSGGADIARSYAAQFYDLSALGRFPGKLLEIGRFCIRPGLKDPDILRLAMGVMTRYVDEKNVEFLFGCSSFSGMDPDAYRPVFALLQERYTAPENWLPGVRAAPVVSFAELRDDRGGDERKAMSVMPALLRSYLSIGGRVSDHAVVDRQLNTLHVFTGLEVRSIPAARKRQLRAIAQQLDLPLAAG